MDESPTFVYDADKRTVKLEAGDTSVEVYSEVTPDEFELLEEVDEFVTEAASLPDDLFHATINQHDLTTDGSYFDHLNDLQHRTASYYQTCIEYQDQISESDSEVVSAQLSLLYKLEKFLKHYFRTLTVGQSLAFSQRLATDYMQTNDYLYLYGFVRNTCSTVEYLGKLLESRMGKGSIDLDDESMNAADVYEEVKNQGLDDVFNEEQELRIPPTNQMMTMGEIGLSTGSMEYLWEKRCDIVHDCPLVVGEEDVDHLPDEIVSTSIITESDVTKLAHLSFRLHFHSVSMFLNFTLSYLQNMVTAMVEALYYDQ